MPKILSPLDRARINYHEARGKLVAHMRGVAKKMGVHLDAGDTGQFDLFAHAMGSKNTLRKKAKDYAEELGNEFDFWVDEQGNVSLDTLKRSKWGQFIKWGHVDPTGQVDPLPNDFVRTFNYMKAMEADRLKQWEK